MSRLRRAWWFALGVVALAPSLAIGQSAAVATKRVAEQRAATPVAAKRSAGTTSTKKLGAKQLGTKKRIAPRARKAVAATATAGAASSSAKLAQLVRERSADTMRDSIVAMARRQVGTPYVLGAGSPERGFDCSGLVAYVMSQFDLRLPRTAATQASAGRPVRRQLDALKPGDLLTFGAGSRTSHIGIYVGGGRFVHASTKAGKVVESKLDRPVTREIKPWRGARRLVTVASATPAAAAR